MSLPISNSSLSFTNSDGIDNFSLSIDSAMEIPPFINTTTNNSNSNSSFLSPLRNIDFALCKFLLSYTLFFFLIK